MTLRMIDEASYQGRTWDTARLKAAGVQVVAVKATEGTDYQNPDYGWQAEQALSAGCVIMPYHLARYGDSQAEADWFVHRGDVKPGDLLMLDNEAQYIEALTPAAASAWTSAFTKEVKRLTGAPAVIQYTSRDPVDRGYLSGVFGREPLFLASPGADPKAPPLVNGWPISFLQYRTRTDAGVTTDVDCAYFGTVGQLRKLAIPGPAPKPVTVGKYLSDGTLSLLELCSKAQIRHPYQVILATCADRLKESAAGQHPGWVLGGLEAAYLDAGDWSAPLPAGSVWWVP